MSLNVFYHQLRPMNTGWNTLCVVPSNTRIWFVAATNVSDADCDVSLAISMGRRGYNRSTAVQWNELLVEGDQDTLAAFVVLPGMAYVGVRCDVAGAANFTTWGADISIPVYELSS